MKILVDREDIVELQKLLHITHLGGPPTFPHPANLSRARIEKMSDREISTEILERICEKDND